MAIFTKDTERSELRAGAGETAISLIGVGMRVLGDIESSGVVKVEGTVEGNIRGARQVLLGRQGQITGDVHARDIVLGGTVTGTVKAAERVEVQGTSAVNGDIYTRTIIVLEGARINGAVRVTDAPADDDASDDPASPPAGDA